LAVARDAGDPRFVILWDQYRLSPRQQRLSQREFAWIQLFDGRRSLPDIQTHAARQHGEIVPLEVLIGLVRSLEEALFLDSPGFRAHLARPVRDAVHAGGCYDSHPANLRRQLDRLFTAPGGPGLPGKAAPDGALRAALVPHIDYARGGVSYGWGFKEVAERADAALFVIIGTSHYSGQRFTLTRQDFMTPLGIVPTDQPYIDRLVAHYGDGLFADPFAHLPEHSIELEVVLLQYLYEGRRPIRIVPLLVGSFHDCVQFGSAPSQQGDIGRMIESLRRVEAETPEPICYIISGDLAHIGPKFGDGRRVDEPWRAHSRKQDEELLRHAEAADLGRYFDLIAAESDSRRICGLPPTYTTLDAARPSRGKMLHYGQYVEPRGHESVSFASVAFYR
jgi:AmmeMemoRadiSam system protein B